MAFPGLPAAMALAEPLLPCMLLWAPLPPANVCCGTAQKGFFPRTCAVSHPLAIWKARKTGESDLPAAPFCAFYSTLSILPAKVNAKKRKKQNSDCGSVDTGVGTAAPPLTAHRAGQLFPRAEISASFAG